MRIQIDEQYKKLCHIQQIKPGRLNYCGIAIGLFLTILTVGIPLLLYWKWLRFKNFIHHVVFEEVENDSKQIKHYFIVDSKKLQGNSRNIIYRNAIITPYLVQVQKEHLHSTNTSQQPKQHMICKYIEHKGLRYVIKDNVLHSIKFKPNKTFVEYFQTGLITEQIKHSQTLYGKAGSFCISFEHVFKKMTHYKHLRFVFMLFAMKKLVFGFISSEQDLSVSITILAEILFALGLMLGISIYGAHQHNKVHEKLQNYTKYKVLRNGQTIELKLNQLCVGDIVIPKIGDYIYFKGLIVADAEQAGFIPYVIVNEKLFNQKDKPIQKTPLFSHQNQVYELNIINPCSLIMNMSVKKVTNQSQIRISLSVKQINQRQQQSQFQIPRFFIIVSDNNYLQKYYECYKQSCYFDNFESIRKDYDHQQLIFQFFFFIVALICTFITAKTNQDNRQHWLNLVLSNIVLCFPFNLILFCNISEVISIIRLAKNGVSVVNPAIQQAGIAQSLSLELSAFETNQFSGFIKKQRCSRLSQPERFEGQRSIFEIYRRGKEESIFSFLGWAGLMNLPYFESEPIYEQVFKKYDFQKHKDNQEQEEHINPRIRNNDETSIKINWQLIQRFPISQRLMQTVVARDLQTIRSENKYFTIVQGEFVSQECEDYFDAIIQHIGVDQYKEVKQILKRLLQQGKKVKYIAWKKFNQTQQNSASYYQFNRQVIQKKTQFGGIVVFDQWPSQENMKTLVQLDNIEIKHSDEEFNITIFSARQENALIGYDHILRKTKLLYEQQSVSRALEVYLNKTESVGITHVGHGTLDQGCLLVADVSINKLSTCPAQADFHITKPQQVLTIFHEGMWSLYNHTLTIVCLVLFNFSKIVGQLVLFSTDPTNKLQPSPLFGRIDKIFVIDFGALIIPLLLLNLFEPTPKLIKKEHRNFFRVQLMFHVIVSLVGLVSLYTMEFLDHGFQGTCQSYQESLKNRHLMTLRTHQNFIFTKKQQDSCEGILDFIGISFAFLVILLLDRSSVERKPRNIFIWAINKLYMLIIWLISIFYFQIPVKNVFRSVIVIIVLCVLVYLSDFLLGKTITLNEQEARKNQAALQQSRISQFTQRRFSNIYN